MFFGSFVSSKRRSKLKLSQPTDLELPYISIDVAGARYGQKSSRLRIFLKFLRKFSRKRCRIIDVDRTSFTLEEEPAAASVLSDGSPRP